MLFRSNDTATTEIYTTHNTLSLHDALPICRLWLLLQLVQAPDTGRGGLPAAASAGLRPLHGGASYLRGPRAGSPIHAAAAALM